MADAYKLKADASFPQAIRKADELADGSEVFETVGRNYQAGSYVLAGELTPRDRERAENGELDHLLEGASADEANEYRAASNQQYGVFIPEHEAEAVALQEHGHETVPRDQVLELKSAGADQAKENLEAAKSEGQDERNITAPEVPSLADVSRGDASPSDVESDHVSSEKLRGVQQSPGVSVGDDLAAAEGAADSPKPRSRPRKGGKEQKSEQGSSGGQE